MFRISVLFLALNSIYAEFVVVQVEQGLLRGVTVQGCTGNEVYYSFKGIPYAAPPVGELRFMAPQPPLPWEGIRGALSHGPICPQTDINTNFYDITSNEDCLYLNVYTPSLKPKKPLPVMFYIHGGFLVSGSGNSDQYGPDFLVENDVIVVTINYRLGVLGFLSLDIEEASGNAGLKDQVAALRWVKRNIARFGGDPDNVTIFGNSAGGSCVTLHLLSPLSKGLFKRAIALSGVFFKEFSLPFEYKRRALLLTQQLGFYTQDPKDAIEYLKDVPVKDLVKAKPFVQYSEQPRNEVLEFFFFRPIVEKNFGGQHFLLEDPQKLLSENKTNAAELILGHTTEEGVFRGLAKKSSILKYFPFNKEFLVPSRITYKVNSTEVLKLGDRIQKHYFGTKEISEDTIREIVKFYSYFNYVYNIYRFLEMWVKTGNKAYFYEFSCYSERNINGKKGELCSGFRQAAHGDDIPYLFDGPKFFLTVNQNSRSYKMIEQTCALYTNFAKYGNPTPCFSKTIWNDYSKNRSYFEIGYTLIPKTMGKQPEIEFWRSIYQSAGLQFS